LDNYFIYNNMTKTSQVLPEVYETPEATIVSVSLNRVLCNSLEDLEGEEHYEWGN